MCKGAEKALTGKQAGRVNVAEEEEVVDACLDNQQQKIHYLVPPARELGVGNN